jgi:hypothetical protein
VVQDDLMLLIHHFYNNSLRVDKLSHAMVYLLLKESDVSVIQKFRPISLVDCSYNFICKILTNRMVDFMHNIVDEAQTTFIKDRFILDNVLAAHEIIHFAKYNKQKVLY